MQRVVYARCLWFIDWDLWSSVGDIRWNKHVTGVESFMKVVSRAKTTNSSSRSSTVTRSSLWSPLFAPWQCCASTSARTNETWASSSLPFSLSLSLYVCVCVSICLCLSRTQTMSEIIQNGTNMLRIMTECYNGKIAKKYYMFISYVHIVLALYRYT